MHVLWGIIQIVLLFSLIFIGPGLAILAIVFIYWLLVRIITTHKR